MHATVSAAVDYFRDTALPKGKWDTAREASLDTYFLGACLHRFVRVYNKWFREQELTREVRRSLQEASAVTEENDKRGGGAP
jgi:hypothetical protein